MDRAAARIESESVSIASGVRQGVKKRKPLDTLLNVALLFSVVLCGAVYALPIFSHQLWAPRSTHNFGTVGAGTEVKHTFTLRNLHPWAVTITGSHSDCGCTRSFVGKTPPFQLAPFQAIDVTATVKTSAKRGHVEQNVFVTTNDNEKGTSLVLRGEVISKRKGE